MWEPITVMKTPREFHIQPQSSWYEQKRQAWHGKSQDVSCISSNISDSAKDNTYHYTSTIQPLQEVDNREEEVHGSSLYSLVDEVKHVVGAVLPT